MAHTHDMQDVWEQMGRTDDGEKKIYDGLLCIQGKFPQKKLQEKTSQSKKGCFSLSILIRNMTLKSFGFPLN